MGILKTVIVVLIVYAILNYRTVWQRIKERFPSLMSADEREAYKAYRQMKDWFDGKTDDEPVPEPEDFPDENERHAKAEARSMEVRAAAIRDVEESGRIKKAFKRAKRTVQEFFGIHHFLNYILEHGTDHEALQAMFNDVKNKRLATIDLDHQVVVIDQTAYYRITPIAQVLTIQNGQVHGTSKDFDLIAPDPILKTMSISFGSDDTNAIKYTAELHCKNLIFHKGRNQLVLANQYQSTVRHSFFGYAQRGILAKFVLQGVVTGCEFLFHDIEAAAATSCLSDESLLNPFYESLGLPLDPNNEQWFTNATSSNSQSNKFTFRDNRVICKPGQIFGIRSQASDAVTVENHVSEGVAPLYGIYGDSRYSTTVDSMILRDVHLEHGAVEAQMFFRGFPQVEINGLRSQIPGDLILKIENSLPSSVVFGTLKYIPWDNPSFDVPKNCSVSFPNMRQDFANLRSFSRWKGSGAPKEVIATNGANIVAFGEEGLKFGSYNVINGRVQESYDRYTGNQRIWFNHDWWLRGKVMRVLEKSNLN